MSVLIKLFKMFILFLLFIFVVTVPLYLIGHYFDSSANNKCNETFGVDFAYIGSHRCVNSKGEIKYLKNE